MKGSRYITHMLRLRNIEKPLANFYASGILNLATSSGRSCGSSPKCSTSSPSASKPFFELLPRNTEALSLARRRDARMMGRSRLAIDATRPLRHAIEIRHPSFMNEEFTSLLKKHDIGLVVADTAGKWPKMFHVTSDFVYVRLHGDVKVYTSGYSSRALAAGRVASARGTKGRDVYVYFDNDVKVRAPFDALNLMRQLGLDWQPRHDARRPMQRHTAGVRVPRLKFAYGPCHRRQPAPGRRSAGANMRA